MKTIMNEVELMTEYTNLVAKQITKGHILKRNRGSNSMYENETHFQPASSEFESLLVALERHSNKKELGFKRTWNVEVLKLVVKNVRHSFDDGEILFEKIITRFDSKGENKGYGDYFYVSDLNVALEIEEKRHLRSSQKWGKDIAYSFNATPEFTNKIRSRKGFTNAKAKKVKVERLRDDLYTVTNTALKTKPRLTIRF